MRAWRGGRKWPSREIRRRLSTPWSTRPAHPGRTPPTRWLPPTPARPPSSTGSDTSSADADSDDSDAAPAVSGPVGSGTAAVVADASTEADDDASAGGDERQNPAAAPVRARASVVTAGALRSDLPASAPVTATTYRATGSASPADVSLPGQRSDSSAPARASATVPSSSRGTASALGTPDRRESAPAVYRAAPVGRRGRPNLRRRRLRSRSRTPTPPGPGPTEPSPPEPEPAPAPGPYPPDPMPTPGPRPTPPPGPVPPVPGPPVPPPSPVPPMPGPPTPPVPSPPLPPPGPPVPAPPAPPGPMPAPPFPPPPAMTDTPGVRASAPVSAPPAGWPSPGWGDPPESGAGMGRGTRLRAAGGARASAAELATVHRRGPFVDGQRQRKLPGDRVTEPPAAWFRSRTGHDRCSWWAARRRHRPGRNRLRQRRRARLRHDRDARQRGGELRLADRAHPGPGLGRHAVPSGPATPG